MRYQIFMMLVVWLITLTASCKKAEPSVQPKAVVIENKLQDKAKKLEKFSLMNFKYESYDLQYSRKRTEHIDLIIREYKGSFINQNQVYVVNWDVTVKAKSMVMTQPGSILPDFEFYIKDKYGVVFKAIFMNYAHLSKDTKAMKYENGDVILFRLVFLREEFEKAVSFHVRRVIRPKGDIKKLMLK